MNSWEQEERAGIGGVLLMPGSNEAIIVTEDLANDQGDGGGLVWFCFAFAMR